MQENRKLCQCAKCRWQWFSKIQPKRCPKCQREEWWLPKVNRRYPLDDLEINQSKILPVDYDKRGSPVLAMVRRMHVAIRNYAKRTGKWFYFEGTYNGLKVTRVK